jgi:hypothetical protein
MNLISQAFSHRFYCIPTKLEFLVAAREDNDDIARKSRKRKKKRKIIF